MCFAFCEPRNKGLYKGKSDEAIADKKDELIFNFFIVLIIN